MGTTPFFPDMTQNAPVPAIPMTQPPTMTSMTEAPSNTPATVDMEQVSPRTTLPDDADYQKRLDVLDKQTSGFLPTAIAIAAMASGNFGPMWQMQEQKRQTAVAKFIAPDAMRANALANQGKFDEAEEVLNRAMGQAGARAPEVQKAYGKLAEKFDRNRQSWQNMTMQYEYLKAQNIPEDSDLARFRDFLGKAVKDRSLMSKELVSQFLEKSIPQHQIINDAGQFIQPLSQRITTVPLQAIITPSMVNTVVGHRVAADFGLDSPADVQNIMNLRPGGKVQLGSGIEVNYGDKLYMAVAQRWEDTREQRVQEQAGKAVPVPPEINAALRTMNYTPEQIATNQIRTGDYGMAVAADQARKIGVAIAPMRFNWKENPGFLQGLGLETFNATLDPNVYGTPLPLQSVDAVQASGGRVGVANKERMAQIVSVMQAYRGLSYGERFLEAIGNPQTWQDMVTTGFLREVQARTGIILDPKLGPAAAYESFLRDAIEQVESELKLGANTRDSREIARMKDAITGKGTNADIARATLEEVRQRLLDKIYGLSGSRLPGTPAGAAQRPQQQQRTGQTGFRGEPGTATNEAQRKAVGILNEPGMNLEQAAETAQQQKVPTAPLQNIAPPGQRRRLQLTR